MRTTIWHVLLLAARLILMRKQRKHLRIAQILGNYGPAAYYLENDKLHAWLKEGYRE